MATYLMTDQESDCTGGADFDSSILTTPPGTGSFSVTTAGETASEISFVQTSGGVPNNDDWQTGSIVVWVNVIVNNMASFLKMTARRMTSCGVVAESTATTGSQNLATAGSFEFITESKNWAAGACDDRLRVDYDFENTAHNELTIWLEFGTNDTEHRTSITEDTVSCGGDDQVVREFFQGDGTSWYIATELT